MKRISVLLVAAAALLVFGVPGAMAADIEIPIDTVVRADEGSLTVLATSEVPEDLIGVSCVVTAEAHNQSSVHVGNDLIVASGEDSIVLKDVERSPGAVTSTEASLLLGASVTVSLRMGADEVFSGGLMVAIDGCAPPTTTSTTTTSTTTTLPPTTTTTTTVQQPTIVIDKTADPVHYGDDGIGHFTIVVTNPGPVDLHDVHVTDDVALATDPDSDCPNPSIPDLAVGDSYTYYCTIGNLDGVSPFTNEATAIGTGPNGTEVTDTDDATVFPPVSSTTITQPPTTAPPTTVPPTLPVTGLQPGQTRGFGFAGVAFVLAGVAFLTLAATIGQIRLATGEWPDGSWLRLSITPLVSTDLFISLRPVDRDSEPEA